MKEQRMTELLNRVFGHDTAEATRTCCICKGPALEFKDEVSRREYGISKMCQECQDYAFRRVDDEDEE